MSNSHDKYFGYGLPGCSTKNIKNRHELCDASYECSEPNEAQSVPEGKIDARIKSIFEKSSLMEKQIDAIESLISNNGQTEPGCTNPWVTLDTLLEHVENNLDRYNNRLNTIYGILSENFSGIKLK